MFTFKEFLSVYEAVTAQVDPNVQKSQDLGNQIQTFQQKIARLLIQKAQVDKAIQAAAAAQQQQSNTAQVTNTQAAANQANIAAAAAPAQAAASPAPTQ